MFLMNWDAVGERIWEAGLDRGVLYTATEEDPYGKGTAFNGLTEMTEKPGGAELTDLWADNIKYASIRAAETFGATMGAYTYPPEFEECDGSVEAIKGVYLGQQTRKPFGFSYRSMIGNDQHDGADLGYKIHLLYGMSAQPSERARNPINESPDATTFSWELNSTPVAVPNYKPVSHLTIDSTKVDATKLAEFEKILYGTPAGEGGTPAAVEARLPLPAEVIEMMSDAVGDE